MPEKRTESKAPRLGAIIRSLREQRGLTQLELAEKAGIQQSRLSRIETMNRDVTADVLARVASALDLSVEEIYLQAGMIGGRDASAQLRSKRMERIFQTLPPDTQEQMLAIAAALSDHAALKALAADTGLDARQESGS